MPRIQPARRGSIKKSVCMRRVNLSRMKRNYVQAVTLRSRKKMDTKLNAGTTILAPDLTLRPAQWADLNAVAQLMYEVWEHDGDVTMAATSEDLQIQWQRPDFNLE